MGDMLLSSSYITTLPGAKPKTASKKLILSHAESRYRYGSLTISEPSRFIDEIDKNLIEQTHKASFKGTRNIDEGFNFSNPFVRRTQTSSFYKEETPKTTPMQTVTPAKPSSVTGNIANPDDIKAGMRVYHNKFGFGNVVSTEGTGANKKALVTFDTEGDKRLMLTFAKLIIIE